MSSSSSPLVMNSSEDAAPAGTCCNSMGNGKPAKGAESEGVKGTACARAPAFDCAVGGETTRECGCGLRGGWRELGMDVLSCLLQGAGSWKMASPVSLRGQDKN